MANVNFFRGRDVSLKFYQDGNAVLLNATNWSVEQNATEVADGINGETRDRLDIVTNYYSASADVLQNDQEVMKALIADQENEDASALPLSKSAAVVVRMRDGTRAAFILRGVVLGPFSETMSGRSDGVKLSIKFRFTSYTQASI